MAGETDKPLLRGDGIFEGLETTADYSPRDESVRLADADDTDCKKEKGAYPPIFHPRYP